jgi:K+-transporting ATPase ATPase C chain
MILGQLRPAITLLVVLTAITGVLYPVGMTLAARALFPRESAGSLLIGDDGTVLGSLLIGQPFTGPRWFHGRPSTSGTTPYDPTASGGSNLGPTSAAFTTLVAERAAALRRDDSTDTAKIPVDLVTASASGLDPHISPRSALLQVRRVATARGLADEEVRRLVAARIEPAFLGIFGRPRVNVLALNLALESLDSAGARPTPSEEGNRPPP